MTSIPIHNKAQGDMVCAIKSHLQSNPSVAFIEIHHALELIRHRVQQMEDAHTGEVEKLKRQLKAAKQKHRDSEAFIRVLMDMNHPKPSTKAV